MSIYESDRVGIINKTKCLMPCSFLEYKVFNSAYWEWVYVQTISWDHKKKMLQLTEDPIVYPSGGEAEVWISAIFSSSSIQVMREEEAYSFLSLVADCGGVLGLFVGFNFLMVLDSVFMYSVTFFLRINHNHWDDEYTIHNYCMQFVNTCHRINTAKTAVSWLCPTIFTSPRC